MVDIFDVDCDKQHEAMLDYENTIFEKVYSKYGQPITVPCDECDYSYLVYVDGEYTCPTCGKIFDRKYVFDWTGLEYWPECVNKCKDNLGNCYKCKFGHLDD